MGKNVCVALCVLALSITSLAACQTEERTDSADKSGEQSASAVRGQAAAHEASGDIIETTASRDELPSFLDDVDPLIADVYEVAAKNDNIVKHMACYCGCGDSVGHKSNLDCFISEIKETGEVEWNSHAITCMNCLEIAAESVSLTQKGKSLSDVRAHIDDKYREGYAEPTPTPLPDDSN
ncbi:PCYCGC motif-containing (lipo)protein [Numidum massiliense]|uniref:PCYCGC motif-containing (lipo)protein n=1 Tax=Numidum massiliense TaxID=1522315 RepID=UPI0036F36CDA